MIGISCCGNFPIKATMPGISLRKAFRKLFRLRRTNSDSGLNRQNDDQVGNPGLGSEATLTDRHRTVDRSRSHGAERGHIVRQSNGQDVPEFLVSMEYAEHVREMDTARSIRLAHQASWYWGPINAAVAETILEKEKDGTFLVRDSTDDRFLFSLSCKYDGKVGHIRIEHMNGSFMFRKIEHYKCDNIRDFIEQAVEHSQTGTMHFITRPRPGVDATRILLLYPLSRQRTVQSLQHLARFTILEKLENRDGIAQLPIPLPLKKYLNKAQYFVEMDRRERLSEPLFPN